MKITKPLLFRQNMLSNVARRVNLTLVITAVFSLTAYAHNTGEDCLSCHVSAEEDRPLLTLGGTVFKDSKGAATDATIPLSLIKTDGSSVTLDPSNADGNLSAGISLDGSWLARLGNRTSRTWHVLPAQNSCNTCHTTDTSVNNSRSVLFPALHTTIPQDNACTNCHHFPASQSLARLRPPGVLTSSGTEPVNPGSSVRIGQTTYAFDPDAQTIATVRPDIFAPGWYSLFDAFLAVCKKNSIPVEYAFDSTCMTNFVTSIGGTADDYWYHFSYDGGGSSELGFKRANRWDEALWRAGAQVRVVTGEDLASIKKEYREEITRERSQGHVIPLVNISIKPASYLGNPAGSGRISVTRQFTDVAVTPHNLRAAGTATPWSRPFQPGVVTSLDIPLSLKDQGKLTAVTSVFYTRFAGNYINSYYLVEMGFPAEGSAHSSGRQGFVYVTENGSFNALPNGADNKLHMTSDINVVHAPDFSYWRWIELGNPYYENDAPTKTRFEQSINEDYAEVGKGFNLHSPILRSGAREVLISFNIFHPGNVELYVCDLQGKRAGLIFSGAVPNIGIHTHTWKPGGSVASGRYVLVMKYDNARQVRSFSLTALGGKVQR